MVIAGYVAVRGCSCSLVGLTGNLVLIALGLLFGVGVANMVFVIPSQTLFQQRTPPELMGRVVELPVRARLRVDDDRDGASAACSRRSSGAGPVIAAGGPDLDRGRARGPARPAVRDA